jgi:diadenosine tetraphosphate (Ap4A) HIT family hydrolase
MSALPPPEAFHFHLHVSPRYAGDGFTIGANWAERSRDLLDAHAEVTKRAAASVHPQWKTPIALAAPCRR